MKPTPSHIPKHRILRSSSSVISPILSNTIIPVSYSTANKNRNAASSSFSVVSMKVPEKEQRSGKKRNSRPILSDAEEKARRKPTTHYKQETFSSGIIKPRLPQDLEDELTFEEFMSKMMRKNDFEAMYRRLYGKEASSDEEYLRFKEVMLADPLADSLADFRKDESVDIVELTREQYLDYRDRRVELKYAYGKHGYEKIKIYHKPNRKGLYELHLFKPMKPLDKNEIFQMNRIKYQLRNVIGLSSEHVDELKRVKKEHDDKKMKRIQEDLEEKMLKKQKKVEERERKEHDKNTPLIDRFRDSLESLAQEEIGKRRRKRASTEEKEKGAAKAAPVGDGAEQKSVTSQSKEHREADEINSTQTVTAASEMAAPSMTETATEQPFDTQSFVEETPTTAASTENASTVHDSDFTPDHFEAFFGKTMPQEPTTAASPQEGDVSEELYNEELDVIRDILTDEHKMKQLASDLNVPVALLREIYFQGGAEEVQEMERAGDIDEGDDLSEKEMQALAKELVNKTKFDLDLTKRVLAESVGENAVVEQRTPKTKPVLKFVYDSELEKFRDMTPEERIIEMREEFAKYTIGMVTLPYHVYRAVKSLVRSVPRDELFRAAKVVSTVMRVRMGGFGRKFEAATFNSRIDVDDLASEQKHILRRIKDYTNTLNLNDKGEFSQLELAEANVAEKQNLKFAYDKNESAAYIGLKLPGFYAVNKRVFSEIAKRMPDWKPRSQLDFGAGPGTSILASNDVWNKTINDIIAIEPSTANMEHALELTKDIQAPIAWRRYLTEHFRRKYDLVTVSYVLNEITDKETRMQTLETLWNATGGMLVIIDSGTPLGFSLVREAREFILSKKDAEEAEQPTILAPCPHDSVCPMAGTRWCHFHQRTERPDFLKQLKNRALLKKGTKLTRSHEDEDYSYIVIRRKGVTGLDPIEVVRERENRRLERLKETDKLDRKKERLRMELLLYKRKLARESHTWPRLIAGSKFSPRKVQMSLCTPQGTLVLGEIYPKTMGRKNGYRLTRTAIRGDLFSFPRRIVDPDKPSSRELYLSKMQNRVRNERMDTKEMNRLIKEFNLIPGAEERMMEARERWKRIKKYWANPKEKSSFMAKDLQHNKSRAEGINATEKSSSPSTEQQSKKKAKAEMREHFEEQKKLDAKTPIMSKRKTAVRAPKLLKAPKKVVKSHKRDRL